MKIELYRYYYEIAELLDEIDAGGDETSARKKIGKIIAENNLDKTFCDLMQKSIGVRYVVKGFHDDDLIYVNLDKSDCQIVMQSYKAWRGFDCPFRIRFEGVVDCIYKSLTALTNEKLYCQREDVDLLPDGNIAVSFTFSNYSGQYVPRDVRIICKDVTITPAPEVQV
ncbi:MAG: hypothetical protein K2O04_02590 [Clostridiales bacterium]|nr:hypothetical protein [Clostridiales bacterium]